MDGEIKIRDGAIIAEPGEAGLQIAQLIAFELGLSHLTIVQPGHLPANEAFPGSPVPSGSRFRKPEHPLTSEEKALHQRLERAAIVLEGIIEQIPRGRYQALALTALEEAVDWAVKGILLP